MKNFLKFLFHKPWEKDVESFLKTTNLKNLEKYEKTLNLSNSKEIDFTKSFWGHAFNFSKTYNTYVHFGLGHYSSFGFGGRMNIGDTLLLTTEKGIGIYRVLHVKYERDPKDMYSTYIVCIGRK